VLVSDRLEGSARGQKRLTTTRAAGLEQQQLGVCAVFVVEHLVARQLRHEGTLAETWPSTLRLPQRQEIIPAEVAYKTCFAPESRLD